MRVLQCVYFWCLVFVVGSATGCRSLHPSADRLRPNLFHRLVVPFPSAERRLPSLYAELTIDASDPLGNSRLTVALESLRLAEETERALEPECLAHYAKAAMASLPVLQVNAEGQSREEEPARMAWEIYQRSSSRLTANAIKFDRFDPQRGIALITEGGDEAWIEVVHSGFPWASEGFEKPLYSAGRRAQSSKA
jgi:hypothetical protein